MCRGRRTIAFVLVGKWGKILNHKAVLGFIEITIGHFKTGMPDSMLVH